MLILRFLIKSLKETVRKRNLILILFLFPIAIISFFAFIFGGPVASQTTYHIGILNNDSGISDPLREIFDNESLLPNNRQEILNNGFGSFFVSKLEKQSYNDSDSTPMFRIDTYTSENVSGAQKLLEQQSLVMLLTLDVNFSMSLVSGINNRIYLTTGSWINNVPQNINSSLQIKGDPAFSNFQTAFNLVEQNLEELKLDFLSIKEIEGLPLSGKIDISETSIISTELSPFSLMVPGFMVFGIILSIGLIAGALVAEKENNTLERIRLARAPGYALLIGVFITQLIIAFFQTILMILTAIIFGFKFLGSLFDILIIIIATEFSVIALGLIIASISSKSDDANSIGTIIAAPVGFVSGSFLPLPNIPIIENIVPLPTGGTRALEIWDFIPTTHAVNAIRSISFYGTSINKLWFELVIIIVIGFILLVLSIILYTNRQLNRS